VRQFVGNFELQSVLIAASKLNFARGGLLGAAQAKEVQLHSVMQDAISSS
jgi:hypothetical protein